MTTRQTMSASSPVHSEQFVRKRKFLLVLPLLVLPFLTFLFWILGGGSGVQAEGIVSPPTSGFNTELPAAQLKDDANWTKMDYYKQADEDSARRLEQIKRDPYYTLPTMVMNTPDTNPLLMIKDRAAVYQPVAPKSVYSGGMPEERSEVKVQQKLRELDRQLNNSAKTITSPHRSLNPVEEPQHVVSASAELRQMQDMMATMQAAPSEPDPDMVEINKALDKLIDVQHPERMREKLQEAAAQQKNQAFPVSVTGTGPPVSILERSEPANSKADTMASVTIATNGFYSLDEEATPVATANAIPAVIHEDQTLVAGATVKLRLTSAIYVQGLLIPKDTYLYGEAALQGERLMIPVTGIQYDNGLYPVALTVYDLDGIPGIHIPGAITRDVAKQSADQSLQQIGMSSLDPSLGAQAASAGIEVTKTLLSKKVKLIKVMVKAGYQVLLKDNNQP